MTAFYANSIANFLIADREAIIGSLASHYQNAGFYELICRQTAAWKHQIGILKQALNGFSGDVLFEYSIPRRGKRIDNVLLIHGHVIAIEFKIGAKAYLKADSQQVEDYCLDLFDFHKESQQRWIMPVLLATDAASEMNRLPKRLTEKVLPVHYANSANLSDVLIASLSNLPTNAQPIDRTSWVNSAYEPTPTIIETAQMLYAGQNVHEITRSHAGSENLTVTSQFVIRAIEQAKQNHEKLICFITGVPGAGKTLAGLNIVHSHELDGGDVKAFLSGNIPLVEVLSEALARDDKLRNGKTLKESRRHIQTFIQKTQHFLKEYYDKPGKVPTDQITVFDEAQRAWDKEQTAKNYASVISQPEMMLEIMDRHSDWAVIIALIGGGQEINTGEAGLPEWGRALKDNYPHWKILISPELKAGHQSTNGQCLFESLPENLEIIECNDLHLNVSLRSFKAEKLSEFIDHALGNRPALASTLLTEHLTEFPIAYTRSLEKARQWLRDRQRGTRRIGLLASSGARRLKAYGLHVQQQLDYISWLLNPADDVRSSFFLEDPATEFSIQGLELDWACVCWDGDLSYQNNQWLFQKFSGSVWQQVQKETNRRFLINKYRVLLTRAREGLIIWIPEGSTTDITRVPTLYDGTAEYFKAIGLPQI